MTEQAASDDALALDRCLTMSALSALIELRAYHARDLSVPIQDAILVLRTQFADMSNLDYDAAQRMHDLIPVLEFRSLDVGLRAALTTLIHHFQPWWLALAPSGRASVVEALTPDQVQCFESAGLLSGEPSAEIIDWWDSLARTARNEQDAGLLARGRDGERLTVEYELCRLKQLGIDRRPRWMSIDNNRLGYDVLSYDFGRFEPTNRLIEVKATSSYPLIFHVTSHEWREAISARSPYVFHIWHVPTRTLYEYTPGDLALHIPLDRGAGEWESAAITIPQQVALSHRVRQW